MKTVCLAGLLLLAGCGGEVSAPPVTGSDSGSARRASLQQAAGHYLAQLEQQPDNAAAHHGLGAAYAALGDTAAARAQWQAALALEPQRHETRLALARLLAAAGAVAEAEEQAAALTAAQPENMVAWLLLADLADRRGDFARAYAAYARVLQGEPDAADARARGAALLARYARQLAAAGRGAEAQRIAQQGLQLSPDDRALLLALAAGQAATGQMLLAQHTLAGLRQRLPDDAEVAGELATLYARLGRPAAALALWQEQRARRSLTAPEQVWYAATLLHAGERTQARELLVSAGDALPAADAQRRAMLLAQAGDTGAALAALRALLDREFAVEVARLAAQWEEERGGAAGAITLYRQIGEYQPGDTRAALAAARLLAARGEAKIAFQLLAATRAAAGADAAVAAAQLRLAEQRLRASAPEDLADCWREVTGVTGERPELVLAAADAYLAAGLDSAAVVLLTQRVPVNTPGRAARLVKSYWRLGDHEALAAMLPAALAEQPDDAWLRGQRAVLLARRGGADARAAEEEFRAFLTLAPGRYDGVVHLWLAELARAAGRLATADRYYARAFAAGADPRYRVRWARCRELAGDRPGAEQLYRRRLDEAPDDWRAHFGLAAMQTRRGALADAQTHWLWLARQRPETALPRYMLGYRAYAAGDMPAALAAFNDARQRRPELWEAAYASAVAAEKMDRHAEALAAAEWAMALAPERARPAYLRAKLLRQSGRGGEAEEILRPLLNMAQPTPEVRLLHAYLQRDAGNAAGAAATLTGYLLARPNDREAQTLLADLYTDAARGQFAAGALAEAERYARAALALDPPQGDALLILAETALRRGDAAAAVARWRDYQQRGGARRVRGRIGTALLALAREAEALVEFRAALADGERDTAPYAALAAAARRQGDLRQALVYYGQWLELAPDDEHGRLQAAAARMAAGQLGDAIADYQRVLAVNPGSLAAAQELAALYRAKNEPAAAARVYETLVRAVPASAPAWHNLGLLYRELGDHAGAAAAMAQATELAPDNRAMLLAAATIMAENNEFARALQLAERAGGQGDELRLDICRRWGDALAAAGDDSGALRCYERMTALAPARWEGWQRRGATRLRTGALAAAVRDLLRAVQLAPPAKAPMVELGDAYAAQGLLAAALAEYARAAERQPENSAAPARAAALCAQAGRDDAARQWLARVRDRGQPAAHLAAGLLALHNGNVDAARRELTRAVELDPRSPAGYIALARAHERAGDLPAALTALWRAQALQPDDAQLAAHEGALRDRQNDAAGAEAAYRRALALLPSGETRHNLAELLRRGGRLDAAEAEYRTVLADPRFRYRAYALNGLGLVAYARRDYPTAIARFGEALGADARYAEPATNLAALYHATGNPSAAQAAARQALARDGNAHRAHYLLALLAEAQRERAAARRELAEALRLAPDNGDYRALAARLGE